MNKYYRYIRQAAIMMSVVIIASSCGEDVKQEEPKEVTKPTPGIVTKRIPFTLLKEYPHKTTAYTEGLQYVDGYMYESTGQYGNSYIYKYDLQTGKVLKEYKMDDKYFGEGLTVLGDKMYVLTYRAQKGFVFDKNTFKQLGSFNITAAEGWGMTNDSTYLIYSDGSPNLYYLDPQTFNEVKRLQVMDKYGLVGNINELEYINGYIYANQWERDNILKIDPANGHVVAEFDMRRIRTQAGIPENRGMPGQAEVMNGIAYDKATNRIFVTGKNWDKTLEVKLDN